MYRYIVLDRSAPYEEISKSIFKFLHLLIRELINGLSSAIYAILVLFSVEMHY